MTTTTTFFVFIPLLAIILLAVNLIFAPHNPYQAKDSAFECGFHSFLGQNRTQFSISFFIFALLFLLFDLEILLVYPYVVSAYTNGIYGLTIMLIFFLALTLGFAFELGKNALNIESRQEMVTLSKKKLKTAAQISSLKRFFYRIKAKITLKRLLIMFICSTILVLYIHMLIYGRYVLNIMFIFFLALTLLGFTFYSVKHDLNIDSRQRGVTLSNKKLNTNAQIWKTVFYRILTKITLKRYLTTVITAILLILFRYVSIVCLDYPIIWVHGAIGLLSPLLGLGISEYLSEYLGINGDLNLYQVLHGRDSMYMGDKSSVEITKPKQYNAMDVDPGSDTEKKPDKGKSVDREIHPYFDRDKVVRTPISSLYPVPNPFYAPAGFNVPGGEVPIRDDICKHIDYNSHILNQFKRMDLNTALEQRKNYLIHAQNLEKKIDYAQSIYTKIPTIATTKHEFDLRDRLERDLVLFKSDKERSEARATLLKSRIEFIEAHISGNKPN